MRADYARAITDYTMATQLDPNMALAYYNRGLAYFQGQKNYGLARRDWERVLQIDPNYQPARQNLAVLRSMGY
jgi:tetratricopeptide (TPR) repeat protein